MNMPDLQQERRRPGSETLSPSEAAYVAAVSRKTVDQAIDRGEVTPARSRRRTDAARTLEVSDAVYLRLRRNAGRVLSSEGKRRLYERLSGRAINEIPGTIDLGSVGVRTEIAVSEVLECLARLRGARNLVVSDPEVRGGEPVVRDTRIPVHLLAEMVAQGTSPEAILAAYPALTAESLDAAVLFAQLHPRRGRPRSAPWREQPAVRVFMPDELGDR
jgi:uncharacterized protein (DUF433 family)